MLRARDALPAPYDFTQTWVDGAPRRGRLMFVGHSEMDGPYYVMIPLHLLCVWYDIQSFGYVSMHALDKNEMNASLCDIWASIHVLFFDIYPKCYKTLLYLESYHMSSYAPYANNMLQLSFLDCINKTCFERNDIVILHSWYPKCSLRLCYALKLPYVIDMLLMPMICSNYLSSIVWIKRASNDMIL